jgi:hypothetical protein
MSEKSVKLSIRPQSSRQEIADYINHAFETSDIVVICEAIGAVAHLHNISDVAKKSGIERGSVIELLQPVQSIQTSRMFWVFWTLWVSDCRSRRARASAQGRRVRQAVEPPQRFSGRGFAERVTPLRACNSASYWLDEGSRSWARLCRSCNNPMLKRGRLHN